MFSHIKFSYYKTIEPFPLVNLGKINIICGKNSSGKSTLLEAISADGGVQPGKTIGDIEIEMLYQSTINRTGWHGDEANKIENGLYRALIKATFGTRERWFRGEEGYFYNEMDSIARSNPTMKYWGLSETPIVYGYRNLFKDQGRAVLIPPNRIVASTCQIQTGTQVQPTGNGLIEFLFDAKNRPSDDDKWILYQRIHEGFEKITNGSTFEIFTEENLQLRLFFTWSNGKRAEADAAGLGFRELLVLLYYACEPDYSVVLIEEPETHLHPEWQRKFLAYLRASTNDKQFFISTHSNIFLDPGLIDRVFFTRFDELIQVEDETSRARLLADLGYSVTDNLISDLIILVEGPTDAPVIEEFLTKMMVWGKYIIKIWPIGGDIMGMVDLSVFTSAYKIIALVDKDPGSEASREKFIDNCEEAKIPVTYLERNAIENYFSIDALRLVVPDWISHEIHEVLLDEPIGKQLSFGRQRLRELKRKNREIAQAMDLKDIEGTDLKNFFDKVEKMCRTK